MTGMTESQTPAAQTSASQWPIGTQALDLVNGRIFEVGYDSSTLLHVWRFVSSTTGLDGQQTIVWGGAAIAVNVNQRILDAYSSTRNPAAVVGGITPANFAAQPNAVVLFGCKMTGVRWTRQSTTGAIASIGVFRNGVIIAPVFAIAAGGPSVGQTVFATPVQLLAGDRLSCQGIFSVATTTQMIFEASLLPPA